MTDLIGYITTGNFNLAEGSGTGIGSILLSKVMGRADSNLGSSISMERRPFLEHLCIIRDSGQTVGRLARWDLV
jgi:ribonuclease P/MRP protein subunit POP1